MNIYVLIVNLKKNHTMLQNINMGSVLPSVVP